MTLVLDLKRQPTVPLDLERAFPGILAAEDAEQVIRQPVLHGRRRDTIADWFRVHGQIDSSVHFKGDLARVHGVGAGLDSGEITVSGNCGNRLGWRMRGGTIRIEGDTGDLTGAEMTGGQISVSGSTGNRTGASAWGDHNGMNRGTILVGGDVGDYAGADMRRGLIVVTGNAGRAAGYSMRSGSIMIGGKAHEPGVNMKRGTICLMNGMVSDLPPVCFRRAGQFEMPVMRLLIEYLRRKKICPDGWTVGKFELFHGDMSRGGRGEMLIGAATP